MTTNASLSDEVLGRLKEAAKERAFAQEILDALDTAAEEDAALRAKVAALVAFARTTCTCQQLPFEQTMPCETCELLARIDGDEL